MRFLWGRRTSCAKAVGTGGPLARLPGHMDLIAIRHFTRYRYARPVGFGEHRMMFRPRESFDQHVLDFSLVIRPAPDDVRYIHDVFGNTIGVARFSAQSDEITFESFVRLEHTPERALEDRAAAGDTYPFAYATADLPDLYPSLLREQGEAGEVIAAWARRFLDNQPKVDAQNVLSAMTRAIYADFAYVRRFSGPPQAPTETLVRGCGTCRDFAVLMMEAARSLGLAARYVSGYLYVPQHNAPNREGGGNTHAWVRVFLPQGGWAEFDPTNGLVGNRDLIRVAVVRDPSQASPLSGTFAGKPEDYVGMDVAVDVVVERPGRSRLGMAP